MKMIGLLTCYMNNFGACLQAYALQSTIQKMGNNCEIVRYTPVRSLKQYKIPIKIGLKIRNTLKALHNDSYKYENARLKYFNKFREEFLVFGKQNYMEISNLYRNIPDYDCFVVGSDQVWNPLIHGNQNNKAYFLDFVPVGKRRIAYAPSIGVSQIPEGCKSEMSQLLQKFDVISTREEVGSSIVTELTDRHCPVVLDPTLLLSKKQWENIISARMIETPYIYTYIFGDASYLGDYVKYVSDKTGLKVVTIPMNSRELKGTDEKIKNAGPLEFLSLIKYASLVITDSFHATAFSINLNTPFYSLLRNTDKDINNMNSRIFNILELTNHMDRLIQSEKEFPETISINMDFSKSNSILNERRNDDKDFLAAALLGE